MAANIRWNQKLFTIMREPLIMNNQGFRVLRFWNNDVLSNTKIVLERILTRLQEQPLTPTLSPERGEGDNRHHAQD